MSATAPTIRVRNDSDQDIAIKKHPDWADEYLIVNGKPLDEGEKYSLSRGEEVDISVGCGEPDDPIEPTWSDNESGGWIGLMFNKSYLVLGARDGKLNVLKSSDLPSGGGFAYEIEPVTKFEARLRFTGK